MSLFSPAPKPILSPCIGICRLGADGLCEGCHRSGSEIASWLRYTDEQRRQLMEVVLPQRAQVRRS